LGAVLGHPEKVNQCRDDDHAAADAHETARDAGYKADDEQGDE
jgi:hypothetical protein